jgi:hypothetical protein
MYVRFYYGRMAGDGVHLPLNMLPDGRFCRSHRKLCSSIVEDLLSLVQVRTLDTCTYEGLHALRKS